VGRANLMNTRLPRFSLFFLCAFLLTILPSATAANPASTSAEALTARYFESIRNNPNLLLVFLRDMPKGADLHNHLTGGIYAESFIQWAAEAGDCVDPGTLNLSPGPCQPPLRPVADGFSDPGLYAKMIDAFSMRNWQYSGQSGHDHFFDAFGKYWQATQGTADKMLAESAARAASQHEVYQELMYPPGSKGIDALAKKVAWDDDFGKLEQNLIKAGLPKVLAAASQELRDDEAARDRLLHCGTPQADPGCGTVQRFLFQVARGRAKEVVFTEILSGFLLSGADPSLAPANPHMVGLNLVMPEDWYVPMTDFPLHMRMLAYLHERYLKVHIALHAGELVQGLVPPEGLRFHIRDSIEIAHAERIGHGVDVMNETNPQELLHEMAGHNIMVEICLTSNAMILGVSGPEHPLSEYLSAGVPLALATDDEGVSRSDMTHEYLRGAEDQKLSYLQLKKMARTSLEHAFLPGSSLWRDGKNFVMVKECASDVAGAKPSTVTCRRFVETSDKARLQWELEGQFREFEQMQWTIASAAQAGRPAR
jgi:adenosine deaminase